MTQKRCRPFQFNPLELAGNEIQEGHLEFEIAPFTSKCDSEMS